MKKIIITGGAGFIGSTLVKALLENGAENILIIDDLSTGSESNISLVLNNVGLDVEYLELVDPYLLKPVKTCKSFTLLAASIKAGQTRLIDHCFLMNRKPIVAIDGPAGAGKSTVTKSFAKKLGLVYLDTGAMYRAVAWLIQHKGINPKDNFGVMKSLKELKLELEPSGINPQVIALLQRGVILDPAP